MQKAGRFRYTLASLDRAKLAESADEHVQAGTIAPLRTRFTLTHTEYNGVQVDPGGPSRYNNDPAI